MPTTAPLPGAVLLMVTLRVANAPESRLEGVTDTEPRSGPLVEGVTVTVAVVLEPP
jgi:hypothetical protein